MPSPPCLLAATECHQLPDLLALLLALPCADFGLSRMLDFGQTHVDTASVGTATHASPELLLGGKLTRASDVGAAPLAAPAAAGAAA